MDANLIERATDAVGPRWDRVPRFWRTQIDCPATSGSAPRSPSAPSSRPRLQLDPHFLFNALNGVAEEIPEHRQAALAMLHDLTAYLRHSLASIHQPVVAAAVEADALAAHLRVQQARFGKRLRTRIEVEPRAAGSPASCCSLWSRAMMIRRTLAHFESLLPAPPFAEPIEAGRSAAARLREAMSAGKPRG